MSAESRRGRRAGSGPVVTRSGRRQGRPGRLQRGQHEPGGPALRRRASSQGAAGSLPPPRSCISASSPGGGKQAATCSEGSRRGQTGTQATQPGPVLQHGRGGRGPLSGGRASFTEHFPSSLLASPPPLNAPLTQLTPTCSSPLSFPVIYSDGLVSDVHTALCCLDP